MCTGNRAPQATFWVNEQVKALWQLSNDCVNKHALGVKPATTQIIISTALAQFCVGRHPNPKLASKADLDFYAAFDAPKIQFICNHDVLVTFKLTSGQFKILNKDKTISSDSFGEYHCAFRVPFKQHLIIDRVGESIASKATFLVLDLKRATFVHEASGFQLNNLQYSDADRKRRAIVHNLSTEYLPLLIRSGFHFIQSLPDFDDLSSTHHIDWSVLAKDEFEIHSLFGINIAAINAYLRGRWLEAAWHCEEVVDEDDHCAGWSALAERDFIIGQFAFHVSFAPPQIRALCAKEVILFLDIPEVVVHGISTSFKWSNWKIAVVVEVILEEEEEGKVQRLRLDFANARFCEVLSLIEVELSLVELRSQFIEHLCTHYLTVLIESKAHYIYYIDLRLAGQEDTYGGSLLHQDPKEHICVTDTFGFDFVTAFTQASVNQHLRHLYGKLAILKTYQEHDFFCSFDPPRIQLPCDSSSKSVTLSLALKDGWLRLGDKVEHAFKNWTVSFDVELKFVQYAEKDLSDHDLCLGEGHSKYQLILAVKTAKFRPEFSHFPGLLDDTNFHIMRLKYTNLVRHLRDQYLHGWLQVREKFKPHVLYVLPSRKGTHSWSENKFSLTSPDFKLCHVPSALTPNLSGRIVNRGAIVIFAMIHNNKDRPSFHLPRSTWNWKYSDDPFHGTVVLSRDTFLDRWINLSLNEINACTTLIPKLRGVAGSSDWKFKLVTLKEALGSHADEFEWIKGRAYNWKIAGTEANPLTFQHHNHDTWSYRHVGGAGHSHDGTCSMSCKTDNTMVIPTTFDKDGCKVKIHGLIALELTFSGEQKELQWTTKATAEWSSTISFNTGQSGQCLKVGVTTTRPVVAGTAGFSGNYHGIHANFKDAATLLRQEMKEMEGLMMKNGEMKNLENITAKHGTYKDSMQEALNERFKGPWHLLHAHAYPYTLCNPVFNSQGDLIIGLRPDNTQTSRKADGRKHVKETHATSPTTPITGNVPTVDVHVAVSRTSLESVLSPNEKSSHRTVTAPKVSPVANGTASAVEQKARQ